MTLKIYGVARSRASRTIWMAEELGIPYELVRTPIGEGGTAKPAFRKLNPNAMAPVIDDDGVIVWESLAINLYLAKRHGGPLAPKNPAEDGHITMWTLWGATELEPGAVEVMNHTLYLEPAKREPAKRDAAAAALAKPLGVLNDVLGAGGGHVVGRRLTVADINLGTIVFYLRGHEPLFAEFPKVKAWYAGLTSRPAFKKLMALRDAEA